MTELARALHVARPTVSRWERGGRRAARHYWPALATALGLTVDEVGDLFANSPPARFDGIRLPALASARRSVGVSQRALALRLGVAPTTLAMWERAGVRVPLGIAFEVASILAVELDTLAALPPAAEPDPRPLRRLRTAAGMTRSEAAAHLAICVATLARYEAGQRRVPVGVLRRMATAYRRPVRELLELAGCHLMPLPSGRRWQPADVPPAIRALRVAAGMTKVELGRTVSRSGQAVAGWEAGRSRPTPATCRRLETVFGLPRNKFPY
jgi:transcriptional regulator with XRE-family HTH domain